MPTWCKWLLLYPLLGLSSPVFANAVPGEKPENILSYYNQLSQAGPGLAKTLPIYLETKQHRHRLRVSLVGLMPDTFANVSEVLSNPDSYCEFLPLMFNVKSCVVTQREPDVHIKYYVAGKHYASPLTSFRVNSVYRLHESRQGFLKIDLESDEDSFGSTEYRVRLRAIPKGDQTLIYIDSLYAPGRLTRMATKTYIKVFARNKLGFTQVLNERTNQKELISGFPAIIERSAVRAYLALKAMLGNRHLQPERQFEARLKSWFELNQPYKKQLHELEQDQYLAIKRRERRNQLRMQRRLAQSASVKVGLLEYTD